GYAGRLTETILVGNLAVRAGEGQRIEWDAKNLVSTNLPDLNQYVQREYREGWTL
ncbi:MAG: gfo/Idh/MocA family oxidoreductase, partial [Planctomycetota bacterium]|nr:gfo/Idh/MocA family oxidoreductase [Planctomycetota bacterium]